MPRSRRPRGAQTVQRPRFSEVSALNPASTKVNLRLKVLSPPAPVATSARLREATVGDASGSVVLTLRQAPEGLLEALNVVGAPLVVRNGKVSMVKGHIRLDVGKWGKIIAGTDGEEASVFAFEPNTSNDISAVEYELVIPLTRENLALHLSMLSRCTDPRYPPGEAVVPKAASSRSQNGGVEGEQGATTSPPLGLSSLATHHHDAGGHAPASRRRRRPRFSEVSALNPASTGVNLRLKVLSPPAPVGASESLREATVGDASGSVVLMLRAASGGFLEALNAVGAPLVVRNGIVSMVEGHIRLDVDNRGEIIAGLDGEEASAFAFEPNSSNDISAVEYELVEFSDLASSQSLASLSTQCP